MNGFKNIAWISEAKKENNTSNHSEKRLFSADNSFMKRMYNYADISSNHSKTMQFKPPAIKKNALFHDQT